MKETYALLKLSGRLFSKRSIVRFFRLAGVCAFTGLLSAISPYALSQIITRISSQSAVSTSGLIYGYVFFYIVCLVAPRFLGAYVDYGQSLLRLKMIKELSVGYFERLCRLSPQYFQSKNMGYLSQQLNQACNEYYILIRIGLTSLISPLFQLSISIILLILHKNYTIVAACIIYGVAFGYFTNVWALDLSNKKLELMNAGRASYSVLVDSMQNIAAIRQYNSSGLLKERYGAVLEADQHVQLGYWRAVLSEMLVNNSLFFILFGACFSLSVLRAANGEIPVSDVVMVGAYIMALSVPLEALGSSFSEIKQSVHALKKFHVEQPVEVEDASWRHLESSDVVIENLLYRYATDSVRPTVQVESLKIPEGSIFGITGPSGSGKSTLLKLLEGEMDSYAGSIKIGGWELSELTSGQLNSLIGSVHQDAAIFQDTLRFNMLVAAPSASDVEILEALEKAGLLTFLISLPDGLDTELGDRGATISGGQRQRLSLARLFLTKPKIVLLDESTSSLDVENEAHVLESAIKHFQDSTVVLVSHRSSVLKYASHVAVLEDGQITSKGLTEIVAQESGYFLKVVAS